MTFTDIELLLDLRGHLKIVHHVPGRVRLRAGPALYEQASTLTGKDLQAVLEIGGRHSEYSHQSGGCVPGHSV